MPREAKVYGSYMQSTARMRAVDGLSFHAPGARVVRVIMKGTKRAFMDATGVGAGFISATGNPLELEAAGARPGELLWAWDQSISGRMGFRPVHADDYNWRWKEKGMT